MTSDANTLPANTLPIDSYGLIGDMSSAALVGIDGSIDWCCMPRFDSPSVFAAILDSEAGGSFRIAPAENGTTPYPSHQSYLRDTNILKTTFPTPTGELKVTDFMPLAEDDAKGAPHEIHRIARCESGEVTVVCHFRPKPDYARGRIDIRPIGGGVRVRGGHQLVTLLSSVPIDISSDGATARFTLRQGESAQFVMAYGRSRSGRLSTYRTEQRLDETARYWRRIVSEIQYDGCWSEAVTRSLLTLRLMTYRPTGAIIAAPTTSLPENIGGTRNWDYRYAWLRDASFTVDILYRTGDASEGDRYIRWLFEQCGLDRRKTRIVYGISPKSSLKERTLDHLNGYAGSKPVRIGNGAARHLQLDVFGEVMLSLNTMYRLRGIDGVPRETWALVSTLAETVMQSWSRKDRGVWEIRGEQQHFVYSKAMCWAALDRASQIARAVGNLRMADRWSRTAQHIRFEILNSGWSTKKRAFRQRYDDDALDASNLVIPFIGLLPPDDPRILQNAQAIERELSDGPFVRRYLPAETDDGFGGESEGAFTLLSFWLIGNSIYTGQIDKAAEYFEQMLSHTNHVGLLAEMIDPNTGGFLGNFPQAYSHTGLIHTARNLSRAMLGQPLSDSPV